jgi:hypothetical protein
MTCVCLSPLERRLVQESRVLALPLRARTITPGRTRLTESGVYYAVGIMALVVHSASH